MARRTLHDAMCEATIEERAGVLSLCRKRVTAILREVERSRLPAEEGAGQIALLRNFANDIAIGLHRDGHEEARVREALRPIVKEAHNG